MMGYQPGFQPKLFYHQINLEQRVPKDHLLRKIQEKIDFDFIYAEVKETYGDNGNVSIPPPVILKMLLLLVLYNVRSERELMETIPMRLDWLWFLGYDLDSEVADHSVLSKARARWRRLWRVKIQEYLIAAIQNIEVLLRYGEQPKRSLLVKVNQVTGGIKGVIEPILGMIKGLMAIGTNGIRSLDYWPCWFCRNW